MSQECIKCGHDVAYHSKAAGGCGVEMMNDAGEVCGCTFDTPAAAERDKEILDWNGNEARDNKFRRWPVGDATTTVRGEQPEATMAQTPTLIEWLRERYENCITISLQKTGDEKAGWLEDALYFAAAIEMADQPRLSSEAIESASKEAAANVVEGLFPGLKNNIGKQHDGFVEKCEAVIRAAIEKARSK